MSERRMVRVLVTTDAIDVAAEQAMLEQGGAVATFTGLVRADDGVATLELEHYPGATEAALVRLAEEATRRWSLAAVTIVHRVGPMRRSGNAKSLAGRGAGSRRATATITLPIAGAERPVLHDRGSVSRSTLLDIAVRARRPRHLLQQARRRATAIPGLMPA